jgi:hypothetical protein
MNEHSFIRAVHGYLPPEVFRWKIHDTFAGGVPDAFYAGPASTLFVEYKYVKAFPKRPTSPIKTTLSAQQIHWLNAMHQYNQPVAVVIGCEKQAVILQNKAWDSTLSKEEFLSQAVTFNNVSVWIHNKVSHGIR